MIFSIPTIFKTNILKIDSGKRHSCVIKEFTETFKQPQKASGNLGCWGSNHSGESDIPSSFAVVSHMALGVFHTCALSPRLMACWGNNSYGQTTVPKAFRRAYAVLATYHTCAQVLSAGIRRVGCWGANMNGQTDVPEYV